MRLTRALSGFMTVLAVLAASTVDAGTVVSQKFTSATLGREWVYNVFLPDAARYALQTVRRPELVSGMGQ